MPTEEKEKTVERAATADSDRNGIPRWKKMLLSLATLLVVSGILIQGYGLLFSKTSDTPKSTNTTISHDPQRSFLPDGTGGRPGRGGTSTGTEARGDGLLEDWSPALVKGGLGFFLGFALGCVFRTFFKISALIVGMIFLGVFGLQQIGFIEGFNWDILEQWYDKGVARVIEEAKEFKSFVAGSVPSAGMAGLGIFTGLKRK